MAKRRIKRKYNIGGSLASLANTSGWNQIPNLGGPQKTPLNIGGALGGLSGGLGGIANGVATGISNLMNPSGNSTGVGNALQTVGSIASNIPGVGGLVGAAVNLVGGAVNAAFGSNINEEFVDQTKQSAAKQSSYVSNATDNSSLLSDWGSHQDMAHVSQDDVGTDGWFSNKAKNLTKQLNKKIDQANFRAWSSLANTASNIDSKNDMNVMANFAADGGSLNRVFNGYNNSDFYESNGIIPYFDYSSLEHNYDTEQSRGRILQRRKDASNKGIKDYIKSTPLGKTLWAAGELSYLSPFMAVSDISDNLDNIASGDPISKGDIMELSSNLFGILPGGKLLKKIGGSNPDKIGKTIERFGDQLNYYTSKGTKRVKNKIEDIKNATRDTKNAASEMVNNRRDLDKLYKANEKISNKTDAIQGNLNIVNDYINPNAFRYYDVQRLGQGFNAGNDFFNVPYDLVESWSNEKADGGPIFMRYSGVMSPFGNQFKEGGGIHIKKENRGKFTEYCGGKVTSECIVRGKRSSSPTIRKRAVFAQNARKFKHADGGPLFTHGGIWDNGLTYINEGGSHEENPFEGVQLGKDINNVPNLVEEGEVVYNDYVFSNRLTVPKDLKKKYKIKGKTYADAAKYMSKESEERPNDPISQRGLDASMNLLTNSQEEMRNRENNNKYSHGGELGNLFDGLGKGSQNLKSYSNFTRLNNDDFYTPEYMDFWNWYNENSNTDEGKKWLQRINSGEFGQIGGNTFNAADISRLAHDYKKGPVHNAFSEAARQFKKERKTIKPFAPFGINDAVDTEALKGLEVPLRTSSKNSETSEKKEEKDKGNPLTWLRYAPVLGSAIGLGYDLFSKPDYSSADAVLEAANDTGNYMPVQANPIGNYLAYRPFDRMFYINQLNANNAAGRRAIQNTSGGNRAAAMAGILASDYNYGNSLGNLARQAEEYNLAQRERVENFNRGTNMFNSEQDLKAQMANQSALARARASRLSGVAQAMAMRDAIDNRRSASLSANFTNLFDSLGNIGREEVMKDWINDNPALYYDISTGGRGLGYKGNDTRAKGGYITIKNKKRRK